MPQDGVRVEVCGPETTRPASGAPLVGRLTFADREPSNVVAFQELERTVYVYVDGELAVTRRANDAGWFVANPGSLAPGEHEIEVAWAAPQATPATSDAITVDFVDRGPVDDLTAKPLCHLAYRTATGEARVWTLLGGAFPVETSDPIGEERVVSGYVETRAPNACWAKAHVCTPPRVSPQWAGFAGPVQVEAEEDAQVWGAWAGPFTYHAQGEAKALPYCKKWGAVEIHANLQRPAGNLSASRSLEDVTVCDPNAGLNPFAQPTSA